MTRNDKLRCPAKADNRAFLDGVERQPAQAGPGEDDLDDDDTAEQRRNLQADDCHDIDQGIAQAHDSMINSAFSQTLGARGLHIVGVEDIKHGAANESASEWTR